MRKVLCKEFQLLQVNKRPTCDYYHFELSGCMKLGGQKHFFAMDGGYAYVNWGERNSEIKHYHIPTLTLSYQYQAVKGFHARFGISSWRGLLVGLGKRF